MVFVLIFRKLNQVFKSDENYSREREKKEREKWNGIPCNKKLTKKNMVIQLLLA